MSVVMKIVFSMSLSASLLILLLLFCKPLVKDRLSRQWQYYIWLVVIARLLLPAAPEVSVVGTLFSQFSQTGQTRQMQQAGSADMQMTGPSLSEKGVQDYSLMKEDTVIRFRENGQSGSRTVVSEVSIGNIGQKILRNLWILWLVIALLLLIRRVTVYQSFVKYIKAGSREVSDTALLDRLAQIGEQTGVMRPVELYTNSLVSSPLFIGIFHPCIILPEADLAEADFTYTIWHELVHYKRKDMFYKWLVQLTVCLHWFNPLVWLMGREINRACEFSCDEAVLVAIGEQERRVYGETLLHAMEAGGNYKDSVVSATLNGSAELLKERLSAIMVFRRRSKAAVIVSAILTVAMMMGATAMGAYVEPVRTAKIVRVSTVSTALSTPDEQNIGEQTGVSAIGGKTGRSGAGDKDGNSQGIGNGKAYNELAEQYYKMGLHVQFEAVFSALDEDAQGKWLDTIYADDNIAFFSVALDGLRSSSPLIGAYLEKSYEDGEVAFFAVGAGCLSGSSSLLGEYAERAYADDKIDFFSVLADNMSTELLDSWCARAADDDKINFCSVLVDNMGTELLDSWRARAADEDMGINFRSLLMDADEMDTWINDAQREAEEQYLEWGITTDGDDYYYQGQLVHLFYDKYDAETVIRTIHINPLGTVDVQVTRNIRNQIMSVDYMTEEDVTALFDPGVSSGFDHEEDEMTTGKNSDKSDTKKSGVESDVFRLTIDELPEAVAARIEDGCEARTWYVYRHEGRQYLYYEGFAGTYAYQPAYSETGWRIDIYRLQTKDDGNVLLSLPDNGAVTVFCDGQKVDIINM